MFRPSHAAAIAIWLLIAPAVAQAGYAEGVAAYGSGRHDIAAREFAAAAQAGDAESAYMLGRLYAMGSGVPQDWGQAWLWHDRAARQGHELAADARASLESIMPPQQLAAIRGQVTAPAGQPQSPPVQEAGRVAVVIPRDGGVVTVSPPSSESASLRANGPTFEGLLGATGGLADQVRLVQRRLNREGYFAGPVDGKVGRLTRQALVNYQRDHGLAPTGRLSADLVARLAEAPPTTLVRVEAVPQQQADLR